MLVVRSVSTAFRQDRYWRPLHHTGLEESLIGLKSKRSGKPNGKQASMKSLHPDIIQNPEKVGALFFLALSIAYGLYAFKIPLTLLAQQETFNARTMPFALSVLGTLLAAMIIVLPSSTESKKEPVKLIFRGLDWRRTGRLVTLMVAYALAMTWLGFVIASILYLTGGFYILGERRIKVLLAASIPLVIGIWLLMSKILGMYIAPGEIFYMMGVIE